jgi:ribonucleoside-diphosphate reductase alpha chain
VTAGAFCLEAVIAGRPWTLRHPRTGQPIKTAPAGELFERITRTAWQTGDPGLIFLDTISRSNAAPYSLMQYRFFSVRM